MTRPSPLTAPHPHNPPALAGIERGGVCLGSRTETPDALPRHLRRRAARRRARQLGGRFDPLGGGTGKGWLEGVGRGPFSLLVGPADCRMVRRQRGRGAPLVPRAQADGRAGRTAVVAVGGTCHRARGAGGGPETVKRDFAGSQEYLRTLRPAASAAGVFRSTKGGAQPSRPEVVAGMTLDSRWSSSSDSEGGRLGRGAVVSRVRRAPVQSAVGTVPMTMTVAALGGPNLKRKGFVVPGNERSGRKPLGESILADCLHEFIRRGADLMRRDGIDEHEAAWIEEGHVVVMRQEVVRSKTTLARALLEGEDVTGACRTLFAEHVEAFGVPVELKAA